MISWILFVNSFECHNITKVFLESVPDQGEVLGDIVDHRSETRKTSSYHSFVVEDDQLDPLGVGECGHLRPEPGRFSSLEAVESVVQGLEENEGKFDLARLG